MKTAVHIDTRSQEGRDLVEYLRTLTDIVSFEKFRVEAKKRAKEFLNKQILLPSSLAPSDYKYLPME